MSDKITTAATYTASGGTMVIGSFTANELGIFIGAAVAVLTYLTNLWFKHKHLQIAKAAMDRRLALIEESDI